MGDIFSNLLGTYGPLTVFVALLLTGIGVPLGEDFVVIPAGILIAQGQMDPYLTVLAAYFGVLISDFMWYWLCRYWGTPLLHKRWFKRLVHPRRLLEVKHEIEQRGAWVIVMSRFIPGSRTPAITAAGVLHYPFWKFAVAESVTCLITIPLQIAIGYWIGKGLGTLETAGRINAIIGVVAFMLALIFGIGWWKKYRKKHRKAPRAKAAWLRRFRRPRLKNPVTKKAKSAG